MSTYVNICIRMVTGMAGLFQIKTQCSLPIAANYHEAEGHESRYSLAEALFWGPS